MNQTTENQTSEQLTRRERQICRCEHPGPHSHPGSSGKFCAVCGLDISPNAQVDATTCSRLARCSVCGKITNDYMMYGSLAHSETCPTKMPHVCTSSCMDDAAVKIESGEWRLPKLRSAMGGSISKPHIGYDVQPTQAALIEVLIHAPNAKGQTPQSQNYEKYMKTTNSKDETNPNQAPFGGRSALSCSPSSWQPMATAPRDGSSIVGKYEDTECMIRWSNRPVCMLGSVNGGHPPGWATDGSETDSNLPMDIPDAWRDESDFLENS